MPPPSGFVEVARNERCDYRSPLRLQRARGRGIGNSGEDMYESKPYDMHSTEAPDCECQAIVRGASGGASWTSSRAHDYGEADNEEDTRSCGSGEDHTPLQRDDGEDRKRPVPNSHGGGRLEAKGCTAGGKRPQDSNFEHCSTPQSFVRCGPHHRAELCVLSKEDIERLHDIWWRYRDDLTWPWFDQKPEFSEEDFNTFLGIGQKVVDAMVEEYQQPMVLDQATISNTNHVGHPPHADNVQFDSVWWKGKRIRPEDEVVAAQEGAYVLWRAEKTSYRSYSCTVSLSDPSDFEGGEVQFFAKFGDKEPVASYKCAKGCGVAFCGCQRNIHAVTGVKSGFRLVLLVWTRPPASRVPDSQTQVCYFRPGTGLGVWLTTADVLRRQARKRCRDALQAWVPKDDDDGTCECAQCVGERKKLAWKDRFKGLPALEGETCSNASSLEPTPSTSAGDSPRTIEAPPTESHSILNCKSDEGIGAPRDPQHCPHARAVVRCDVHERFELTDVLDPTEVHELHVIWKKYRDDLTHPWYEKKPVFTDSDFESFRRAAQKVVDAMAELYKQPLVLDQATISCSNHLGHPPHADNVQFNSVWWYGRQVRQRDELVAVRGGAEVQWREVKTNYRNYSTSVALTNPWQYGGGDLEFYAGWGEQEPCKRYRLNQGSGVACCGCRRSIHAVTGVKWGFRFVLLVWTRSPEVVVPKDQMRICYFRPGTGLSVWLTSADLESYPSPCPPDGPSDSFTKQGNELLGFMTERVDDAAGDMQVDCRGSRTCSLIETK